MASAIFACNPRQPLGKTRIATTEGVCAFSYGKEADQLSRLNYYGYRYYDPLSLTWTQADPLYRVAPDRAYDQPRRMSLYSFSLNNPVRYMDPDGRDPGDFAASLATKFIRAVARANDVPHADAMQYDGQLGSSYGQVSRPAGTISIGPSAFDSRKVLVTTLKHEAKHLTRHLDNVADPQIDENSSEVQSVEHLEIYPSDIADYSESLEGMESGPEKEAIVKARFNAAIGLGGAKVAANPTQNKGVARALKKGQWKKAKRLLTRLGKKPKPKPKPKPREKPKSEVN